MERISMRYAVSNSLTTHDFNFKVFEHCTSQAIPFDRFDVRFEHSLATLGGPRHSIFPETRPNFWLLAYKFNINTIQQDLALA